MRRRTGASLLLALAFAAPAAAQDEEQIPSAAARRCDPQCYAAKLADGRLTEQVVVPADGIPRTYWLYEPAGIPAGEPVPLVVVMHGGMGDGRTYEDWTGFDALADSERFVVAYPDGFGRSFNARTCCFLSWRMGTDDVGYMDALADQVSERRAIDPQRVFAAGHSNGAMLADMIACQSSRFTAIAAVSGVMADPCTPSRSVSVLHIHGTADENAPYDGGHGPDQLTDTDHQAVRPAVDWWRRHSACPAPAVTVSGPVTLELSEGCAGGTAVGLYTIAGGPHAWPGSVGGSPRATPPSQALDATLAIWRFFAAR